MTHWFYAVLTEAGTTWSTAVRAANVNVAKSRLAKRYPRATVFSIER